MRWEHATELHVRRRKFWRLHAMHTFGGKQNRIPWDRVDGGCVTHMARQLNKSSFSIWRWSKRILNSSTQLRWMDDCETNEDTHFPAIGPLSMVVISSIVVFRYQLSDANGIFEDKFRKNEKYPMPSQFDFPFCSVPTSYRRQCWTILFLFIYIVSFHIYGRMHNVWEWEWQTIFLSIAQTTISIQSIEITDADNVDRHDDHNHFRFADFIRNVPRKFLCTHSFVRGGFGIQLQTLAIIQIASHHHRRRPIVVIVRDWRIERSNQMNTKKIYIYEYTSSISFQCEKGTTKRKPLHSIVVRLVLCVCVRARKYGCVHLDMKLVIFDGTSKQSAQQTTRHNIDGNIKSKCALCILVWVYGRIDVHARFSFSTQTHVHSAKRRGNNTYTYTRYTIDMNKETTSTTTTQEEKKMNCFSGFYCCQIRILLNAFRNRSNSSRRRKLKNSRLSSLLSHSVAKKGQIESSALTPLRKTRIFSSIFSPFILLTSTDEMCDEREHVSHSTYIVSIIIIIHVLFLFYFLIRLVACISA